MQGNPKDKGAQLYKVPTEGKIFTCSFTCSGNQIGSIHFYSTSIFFIFNCLDYGTALHTTKIYFNVHVIRKMKKCTKHTVLLKHLVTRF